MFRTELGHFEYTVILFGLTNTPVLFQRFITDTLREYLNLFIVVYLDNILVFSNTIEEYIQHNKLILQKLREAKVTLKLKKYKFYIQKTRFLGYIITKEGFSIEEEKVRNIIE